MRQTNSPDYSQLILNGILIALLVYLIFKPSDNSKLEDLIKTNNTKIEELQTEIKTYEKTRETTKNKIDSASIIIGELPHL